jgi:hypothetical protein
MTIKECKQKQTLPASGTEVRTQVDYSTVTDAFFVAERFIRNRRNDIGVYVSFVPGGGGDLWGIRHSNGDEAVYMSTEVFDR